LLPNLQEEIDILRMMKFALVILVKGTHACYHHVVATWRGMITDYESKYTFPLTNDSLRQICGVNTTFDGISCGYGIFSPNHICNSIDNVSVEEPRIKSESITEKCIRETTKKRVNRFT
jgi:hypothetical protein